MFFCELNFFFWYGKGYLLISNLIYWCSLKKVGNRWSKLTRRTLSSKKKKLTLPRAPARLPSPSPDSSSAPAFNPPCPHPPALLPELLFRVEIGKPPIQRSASENKKLFFFFFSLTGTLARGFFIFIFRYTQKETLPV